MVTYKDSRPFAKAIKAAVLARKMPPWSADDGIGHFSNDARLSPSEIDTLTAWADGGAPEGKLKDAPPPIAFVEGWNIGKPDHVFEMPQAFEVPASGSVAYQWVLIPAAFKEDKWIKAVEVRPGARSVVHHVIAFYRRPGSKWLSDAIPGVPTPKGSGAPEGGMSDGSIGAYVPGLPPVIWPEGRATLLPANSDIILQLHYTASGKAAKDQTKVGLVFANGPVSERAYGVTLGTLDFVIPPGEANYRVDSEHTFARDVKVTSLLPHMHLRGKSFEFRAAFPDGKVETLLKVSKYDFNWQLTYRFAEERVFPAGTKIQLSAWFDNSLNNQFNPDAKAAVRFGDQTWEEMMVGAVGLAIDPKTSPATLLVRPPPKKPATSNGVE